LRRWLDGRPVMARPQSVLYRMRKFMSRHRWAVATTAVVTLVLVGALAMVAWQARQAINESARAQAMQNFVIGLFENAGSTSTSTPLDVRQLLAAGVQRGDQELARQPVARAELLGLVARLRLGLGDYEEAHRLLQRQASIIATLDSPPASLRLQAASNLGRTLRLMGRSGACVDTMQPLLSLASHE